MSELVELFLPIDVTDEPLEPRLERALGWSAGSVGQWRLVRRSLDARKGRPLGYRLRAVVARVGEVLEDSAMARRPAAWWAASVAPPRVVIVGSGPAGSWAALRLVEAGVSSTIVELGKPVQPRRRDLALANRGALNTLSNYCFGEGGAGTYSDGKLYTRSKDRPGIAAVLSDLVRFGAPAEIEAESRPHVGSNRLPKVLATLRQHLESQGVVYRFETAAAGLVVEKGRIKALRLLGGDEIGRASCRERVCLLV